MSPEEFVRRQQELWKTTVEQLAILNEAVNRMNRSANRNTSSQTSLQKNFAKGKGE